jgi:hypothetical protein
MTKFATFVSKKIQIREDLFILAILQEIMLFQLYFALMLLIWTSIFVYIKFIKIVSIKLDRKNHNVLFVNFRLTAIFLTNLSLTNLIQKIGLEISKILLLV